MAVQRNSSPVATPQVGNSQIAGSNAAAARPDVARFLRGGADPESNVTTVAEDISDMNLMATVANYGLQLVQQGEQVERRERYLQGQTAALQGLSEEALEADQEQARLGAAVAALPERQRTAVTLSYTSGLSNVEAAAVMEVSVKAFEALLVRAKRELRRRLASDGAPTAVRTGGAGFGGAGGGGIGRDGLEGDSA